MLVEGPSPTQGLEGGSTEGPSHVSSSYACEARAQIFIAASLLSQEKSVLRVRKLGEVQHVPEKDMVGGVQPRHNNGLHFLGTPVMPT